MVETSNTASKAKFDVIGFGRNVLTEIENIRSYRKVQDDNTKEDFGLPVESRINAFFRLVGFPMFVTVKSKDENNNQNTGLNGNLHLTPGYDRSISPFLKNYNIENSKDFSGIIKREEQLLKEENYIGDADKNDDMTSALKNSIPIQANIPNAEIPSYEEILFDDGTSRIVFKGLKPTVTMYLANGIMPIENERARPFLRDPKDQMPNNQTILPKPLIETIIRIRLVSCGGASTTQNEKQKQFSDSIKKTLGEDAFNTAFENVSIFTQTGTLEMLITEKLLNSVEQLAKKWVEIETKQAKLNKDISSLANVSIKTSSAKRSPFGKRVSVIADITTNNNSELGQNLKKLQIEKAQQEALLSLFPTDDVVTNDMNSKIKNTGNVSSSALLSSFVSLVSNDLAQINNQITSKENEIKKKIQEIEILRLSLDMMTGEFTGISIPDVVIVITALFLMEKKDLVSLLDKYVIEDMTKDPTLKPTVERFGSLGTGDAKNAIAKLGNLIDQLYVLFNEEVKRIRDKSKRNKKLGE